MAMAELSINTLVMIVILIVALLAAIYFVSTTTSPITQTEKLGELLSCCSTYTANDCEDKDVTCNGSTIGELADQIGLTDEQLKSRCSCPGG